MLTVPPEARPKIDGLITETEDPVDNFVSEKQMRLLVEPLYDSWTGSPSGEPFVVAANVGIFMTDHEKAIVPDVLLALGVRLHPRWREREQRSFFTWIFGQVPDLALEIVSNCDGHEDSVKILEYAKRGIPYYVVYDPENLLKGGVLRAWCIRGRRYEPVSPDLIPDLGLGLTFWEGTFEHETGRWLRWCDQAGVVIPTGAERAEQERQRAEQERQRAEQEHQRAEQERQRATTAEAQAQQQQQRLAQLEKWLREQGLEPPA